MKLLRCLAALMVFATTWAWGQEPTTVVHVTQARLQSLQANAGPQTEVTLPDEWNKVGRNGLWRYTIALPQTALQDEFSTVYIPRVGNRFAIALNGVTLAQRGTLGEADEDYSRRPVSVLLPQNLLRRSDNTLEVTIYGDLARYAGLSSLDVGPHSVVYEEKFLLRDFLQFSLVYSVMSMAALFGLLALALSLTTRDATLAWFAVACLLCAVRLSYFVVSAPPLSLPWWTWVTDTAQVGYYVCLLLFGFRSLKISSPAFKFSTGLLMVGTTILIPLYAFYRIHDARILSNALLLLYGLAMGLRFLSEWWRNKNASSSLLACAAAVAMALGLYDHVLVYYSADGYGSFTLSRFTLVLFLFALAYVVVLGFADRAKQEAQLRRGLAAELALKTKELALQFERERSHVLVQAQTQERTRIVQDLHDGLGLHLSGILGMVERGKWARDELMFEVRTAIDHMRILVDNTETFEGDWLMLLGTIRHRIETRLKRYDIALHWSLPLTDAPNAPVTQHAAISMQRLFFELTSNVIKHAQAQAVSVRIQLDHAHLEVEFSDDGIGFDAQRVHAGMGTTTIKSRAKELNMALSSQGHPGGGTRYTLHLPLVT